MFFCNLGFHGAPPSRVFLFPQVWRGCRLASPSAPQHPSQPVCSTPRDAGLWHTTCGAFDVHCFVISGKWRKDDCTKQAEEGIDLCFPLSCFSLIICQEQTLIYNRKINLARVYIQRIAFKMNFGWRKTLPRCSPVFQARDIRSLQ